MSNPKDPDPNGLLAAMITYHEVLSNAVQVGFTRKEAFAMVLAMVHEHAKGAPNAGQ